MDNVAEFIFVEMPSLFEQFCNGMQSVIKYMLMSLSDFVQLLRTSEAPQIIVNIVDSIANALNFDVLGYNLYSSPLVFLMLGAGVLVYIVIQIIIWALDTVQ